MTAAHDARTLFTRLTGREPDGLWSAPGRVNLIGEHTDYNDGFVLPFAIPQRTVAAVGRRDDDRGRVLVGSTFADEPVEVALDELDRLFPTAPGSHPAVPEWAAYPLGVAWALRQAAVEAGPFSGLDIAIASDVPVGAGLSSSAAIEGATASALNELWGTGLDGTTLARIGRRAENEAVGAPTGIMDQMASMLGRPDTAIFLDCRSLETQLVPLAVAEAGLAILVIDTRVKHAHSTGGYRERRASCELGASIMGVSALRDVSIDDLPRAQELMDDVTFRRVRHIVTENQRTLDAAQALSTGDLQRLGQLMAASHDSMRDDFEITVPAIDHLVTILQAAIGPQGGARMTGGGFGGCVVALLPEAVVPTARAAVAAQYRAPNGDAATVYVCHASAGVGVV